MRYRMVAGLVLLVAWATSGCELQDVQPDMRTAAFLDAQATDMELTSLLSIIDGTNVPSVSAAPAATCFSGEGSGPAQNAARKASVLVVTVGNEDLSGLGSGTIVHTEEGSLLLSARHVLFPLGKRPDAIHVFAADGTYLGEAMARRGEDRDVAFAAPMGTDSWEDRAVPLAGARGDLLAIRAEDGPLVYPGISGAALFSETGEAVAVVSAAAPVSVPDRPVPETPMPGLARANLPEADRAAIDRVLSNAGERRSLPVWVGAAIPVSDGDWAGGRGYLAGYPDGACRAGWVNVARPR